MDKVRVSIRVGDRIELGLRLRLRLRLGFSNPEAASKIHDRQSVPAHVTTDHAWLGVRDSQNFIHDKYREKISR